MTVPGPAEKQNQRRGIERLEQRRLFSASIGSGPVLDPRQFGAVCDGVTDDSTAIQAAIDALPASGGTVTLSGMSAVGAGGIHLIGRTNVRLTAEAPGDGITVTAVPIFPQNPGQFGNFGVAAIAVNKCKSCQIDGLIVDASGLALLPIGLALNAKTVVANNTIQNASYHAAIYAVTNTADTYSGNTIIGSTNQARGLWIGNTHEGEMEIRPVISNNYVANLSATGIGTMSFGATISGNTVLNCAGAGVALAAGGLVSTSHAVVKNNTLEYNAFHGVQADCISNAYTARDITVSGNTCSFNGNSGIYVVRAQNWKVTGNTCEDNTQGIVISASSGITASGNICNGTQSGAAGTQRIGIEVVAYPERAVRQINLSRNQAFGNTQDGICAATTGGTINTIGITRNKAGNNGIYNLAVIPDVAGRITNSSVASNTIVGPTASIRVES